VSPGSKGLAIGIRSTWTFRFVSAQEEDLEYKKRDLSAELHICAKGGHGFGMPKDGKPINEWPERCAE
jgi:hypothetical protein